MIAAPPCGSLAAIEPLLRVTLLKRRLPPSSMMKNLKLGAPLVGRVIVAPLPTIVTLPRTSGNALLPSAVLLTVVIVYVQPEASVTVPLLPDPEIAARAATRLLGSHGTDAAAACGIEMTVATTAMLPAAINVVRARKGRTATCDSEVSALSGSACQAKQSLGTSRTATAQAYSVPRCSDTGHLSYKRDICLTGLSYAVRTARTRALLRIGPSSGRIDPGSLPASASATGRC